MDLLSTSGISSLINSYKSVEYQRRIYPLEIRKNKFSDLSTNWNALSSKLTSLKSSLYDFKVTSSLSLFNTRTVDVSNSTFLTATAENNAPESAYTLRVNQLAKSDLLVSETQTSATAVTTLAGTHIIQVDSGDYTSSVEIELTDTETNETIMDKLSTAINSDKAVTLSDSFDPATMFSGASSFTIDLNGTESTVSYDYSVTSKNYDEVMDDLVDDINSNVTGILAEKIVDGGTGFVSLQLTVEDSDNYITVTDSGFLNMDVTKEKGASGLSDASVFAPTTDNSKFSITASESGYDNRLIMSDVSGSIFNQVGLTSAILSGRTIAADDTSAGFIYDATSSTDNDLNAKLNFNGINIQRNSNTISDLVSSVTFDLKATMVVDDPDVSVTVNVDVESVKSDINDFINKFNDVYTYLKNNSYSSGDKDSRGIFVGDSTARSLIVTLTNSGIGQVTGLLADNFSYLSEVGIKFDPATGLSISDSSKLETALEEKADDVADLFNSTNGIATTLYDTVENYLGVDGVISNITKSYDNNVTYYNKRIESSYKSMDKSAEILRSRYEGLQIQLMTLLNASNSLSSMEYF
ncbi:MAG: flagellar filament capping protein FliD [Melioribacteraceae bacterium]|nr:flagellar filament capping protein FliD [Melioribacteraceae bacterium]